MYNEPSIIDAESEAFPENCSFRVISIKKRQFRKRDLFEIRMESESDSKIKRVLFSQQCMTSYFREKFWRKEVEVFAEFPGFIEDDCPILLFRVIFLR